VTVHQEPMATAELAQSFGLSSDEWTRVKEILGRNPTLTETGVFSALWSEHCSYKSSRIYLRALPTRGPKVVQGPGENAGAIDLGGGLCAVFKIESHNHPSYIEPVQGAATGVGGILRDIFTMGARPVALMNSLRFGRPDHPKTAHLLRGVVKGVGGYGNAVGIPTVGGEVFFDASYDGNILVNAFALGVCEPRQIVRAVAQGVDNLIVYLGAKTGRDGIHGATMASASFEQDSEEKRPTVQVGDPFKEKLLLEACMEMFEVGCLVGIQDMGAAGLSSSSAEMAARGGVGMEIDTAKVPAREEGMTPYEFMLSESQERMLICCRAEQVQAIERIAHKWDVDCAVIGRVTEKPHLVVRHGEVVAADIPVLALTDEAPVYERPTMTPRAPEALPELHDVPNPESLLLSLLGSANLSSRRWVYRQYDCDVGTRTQRRPDTADAGVVMLSSVQAGRKDALAMTCDVNSRYVKADPYEGAKAAVLEAYANLAATGARGLALSDCLNFGSPQDPEIMGQFARACEGMGEAARVLETPIVSGNVSLYNQTGDVGIDPTPTVAMVGQIADVARTGRIGASLVGCDVWTFGTGDGDLAQSEYLLHRTGKKAGALPVRDSVMSKVASDAVTSAWENGLLHAAHDVADGGLLVALAEVAMHSQVAISARAPLPGTHRDAYLFGEGGTRFVLITPAEKKHELMAAMNHQGSLHWLGTTEEGDGLSWPLVCKLAKAQMQSKHEAALPRIAEGQGLEGMAS
jgi:phosphoribosylformylglycinamidine synthase subunit PurL